MYRYQSIRRRHSSLEHQVRIVPELRCRLAGQANAGVLDHSGVCLCAATIPSSLLAQLVLRGLTSR